MGDDKKLALISFRSGSRPYEACSFQARPKAGNAMFQTLGESIDGLLRSIERWFLDRWLGTTIRKRSLRATCATLGPLRQHPGPQCLLPTHALSVIDGENRNMRRTPDPQSCLVASADGPLGRHDRAKSFV